MFEAMVGIPLRRFPYIFYAFATVIRYIVDRIKVKLSYKLPRVVKIPVRGYLKNPVAPNHRGSIYRAAADLGAGHRLTTADFPDIYL